MFFEKFYIIEYLIFIAFLIPVIYFDIKEKRIPDACIISGIIVLFATKIIIFKVFSIWFLINPIAGFFMIWILWYFSKEKIGLGDAKLCAYIALAAGLIGCFSAVFIASFSGLIFFLIMTLSKRLTLKDSIPFGPFLAFGGILAYFFKEPFYNIIVQGVL